MIKDYKLLIELEHPYGRIVFKISKSEMLSKYKRLTLIIILIKIKQSITQSVHIFQIIYTEYL